MSLERRISGALHSILGLYGIPVEVRQEKIDKAFIMNHRTLVKQVLQEFKEYVQQANEQALLDLLKQ